LQIDSSPNQGARFEVAVPVGEQHEAEPPEPAETLKSPAISEGVTAMAKRCYEAAADDGQRVRILVVDDNDTMREGITCALNDEPDMLVVAEAADGQEAVDQAVRHRPQVIIMDIAMPRLNGIKATELICLQLPQTRIIGLSMHEEEEMVQAMRSAGAADYVPKGSGMEPLIGAIRQQAAVS
jgi:CheY-like chemotaxis protein